MFRWFRILLFLFSVCIKAFGNFRRIPGARCCFWDLFHLRRVHVLLDPRCRGGVSGRCGDGSHLTGQRQTAGNHGRFIRDGLVHPRVLLLHVQQELLGTTHALVTYRAAVFELTSVDAHMLGEVILAGKQLIAGIALVGFLLRVGKDVSLQLVFAVEGLGAAGEGLEGTRVGGAVRRVDKEMSIKFILACKLFSTFGALVLLDTQMDAFLVFAKLGGAPEATLAALPVAQVTLDARMRLLVFGQRVFVAADLLALVARQVVQDFLAVTCQGLLRIELLLAVDALVLACVGRLVRLTDILTWKLEQTDLTLENVLEFFLVFVQILFADERPLAVGALVELLVHKLMDHEGLRTVEYFVADVTLERTGPYGGRQGCCIGNIHLGLLYLGCFGLLCFWAVFWFFSSIILIL